MHRRKYLVIIGFTNDYGSLPETKDWHGSPGQVEIWPCPKSRDLEYLETNKYKLGLIWQEGWGEGVRLFYQ